jgi:hypothetical protein
MTYGPIGIILVNNILSSLAGSNHMSSRHHENNFYNVAIMPKTLRLASVVGLISKLRS